jgi:hypothetical protein
MTTLEFLTAIAPVPIGITPALLAAVVLLQPRRVPARATSQLREAHQHR